MARLIAFGFQIPVAMKLGDHWTLHEKEALDLGAKLNACAQSFPDSTGAKVAAFFEKYIDRYLPFAAFAGAAYMTVAWRVQMTQQMRAHAAHHSRAEAPEPHAAGTPPASSPSGNTSPAASPPHHEEEAVIITPNPMANHEPPDAPPEFASLAPRHVGQPSSTAGVPDLSVGWVDAQQWASA